MALFLAGPIAYCAYIAFTDLQLTGQAESSFVGFDNFRAAFKDDAFLNAVWLTLVFTFLSSIVGPEHPGPGSRGADAARLESQCGRSRGRSW